ncbi:MAG: hypothetical protein EOO27_11700 [Comamonadaceae bacterium]|nr:MAG: hypothetical protein EOO27_11700 [Comamonadaceae bacterium]
MRLTKPPEINPAFTPHNILDVIMDLILGGIGDAIDNFLGSLSTAITTGVGSGLLGTIGGFIGGIKNTADTNTTNQISLNNKVESLMSGGTRYTFMVNGTWTNPGPGKIVGVACLNGGCGGSGHSSTINVGGRGAKYVYQEFKSDDLPSTVAVTVGAAGAVGSMGFGGTSTFGSYLAGSFDGGGILTPQGIMASGGDAGDGGKGDHFPSAEEDRYAGTKGGGNALAAGGTYNATGNGGQGADAPTNKVAVAGGGGGGGAGTPTIGTTRNAGAGGWPGGGGGAAGYANVLGSSKNGAGGAPGAVFVTVKG